MRIGIIGERYTGKTSLTNVFMGDGFSEEYKKTGYVKCHYRKMRIGERDKFFEFYDFAGRDTALDFVSNPRMPIIFSGHLKCDAVLLVCDYARRWTLERIDQSALDVAEKHVPEKAGWKSHALEMLDTIKSIKSAETYAQIKDLLEDAKDAYQTLRAEIGTDPVGSDYLAFLEELAGKLPDTIGQLTSESWVGHADLYTIPRECVLVVVNKSDLAPDKRSFSYSDVVHCVERNKLGSAMEASAKTNWNVDSAFLSAGTAASANPRHDR